MQMSEDFELIRKTLGIAKWLVFGGSWGSTLGLDYTQRFPQVRLSSQSSQCRQPNNLTNNPMRSFLDYGNSFTARVEGPYAYVRAAKQARST